MVNNAVIGVAAQLSGTGQVIVLRNGSEHVIQKGEIIYQEDIIKTAGDAHVKILMIDGTFVDIAGSLPFDCSDYLLIDNTDPRSHAQNTPASQHDGHTPTPVQIIQNLVIHDIDPDKIATAIKNCALLTLSPQNQEPGNLVLIPAGENVSTDSFLFSSSDTLNSSLTLPDAASMPPFLSEFVFQPVAQTEALPASIAMPPPDNSVKVELYSTVITVNNATPALGQDITYTYSLSNFGTDTATNIVVDQVLGDGLNFVSAEPSIGQYDPATGEWTISALNSLQTATLTVQAMAENVLGTPDPFLSTFVGNQFQSANLYAFEPGTPFENASGILNIGGLAAADNSVVYTSIGYEGTPLFEILGAGPVDPYGGAITGEINDGQLSSNALVVDLKTPVQEAIVQLSDLYSTNGYSPYQYAEVTAYDALGQEVGNFITGGVAPPVSLTSIPNTVFIPFSYLENTLTPGTYGTITIDTPLDFQYLVFTALTTSNLNTSSYYFLQAIQSVPGTLTASATITQADQSISGLSNTVTTISLTPQMPALGDNPSTFSLSSADILSYSNTEVQDLSTLLTNIVAPPADKVLEINGSPNDNVNLTGAAWTEVGETHPLNNPNAGYYVFTSNNNTVALVSLEIPLNHIQHT
jgi:uncharacterized repeat protein (TIGR01451 family)